MEHKLTQSADGSTTLQLARFNETYHSRNGAYTEAQHIYIQNGVGHLFETTSATSINIFDVGFGTGLNCILAWVWQQNRLHQGLPAPQINYWGIEKYPILSDEIEMFNYPQIIAQHTIFTPDNLAETFKTMHSCPWGEDIALTEEFTLHKSCSDITTISSDYYREKGNILSAIFYDTFSPATQPYLWNEEIFRNISSGCASGSTLVTYCCKGTVKQALRNAGFTLERLAGPPGKRHILRARI